MHILLSTFPLSFFFFDFSRGKISIFKREWKRGKPFFSHNFWMPKNRFVSIMLTTDFSKCCPRFHSLFFFFIFQREKFRFLKENGNVENIFSHNFGSFKNWFVSIMLTTGFFIVVKSILEISKLDKKKMSNFEKTKIVFQKKCIFLFVSGMLRKFFTEKNFVTEEKKKNTNSG